jgi:hypothetical protein
MVAHEPGLIMTASDFSKGSRAETGRADLIPVALMNGEQLVEFLVENVIDIRCTSHEFGSDENIWDLILVLISAEHLWDLSYGTSKKCDRE